MRSDLLPSFALVMGGVLWGLFWIPLRALDEMGISGGWPGALVYFCVVLILLPVLLVRRGLIKNSAQSLAWCGLFTGTAFTLYGISLFYTDVVRVLLLFYVTPVWSTLLGFILLGERISLQRMIALVVGLCGLLVILGIGENVPWPRNTGDWLALFSGMAWAYGTLCIYRLETSTAYEQVLAFSVGGVVVSVIALLVGGPLVNVEIKVQAFYSAIPLLIASSLFLLPMLFLTIWPTQFLSPGRVGLLLMSEVIVGIGSAALLTGEPFGMREMIGTLLVISSGLVEVFGNRTKRVLQV